MSLFGKWASTPASTDIADAVFKDEQAGMALLDRQGIVLRANAGLVRLLGAALGEDALAALPGPAAKALIAALRTGRPASATASFGTKDAPRVLALALLPLSHGGGLLRVTDRTHEQAIEEQLGQSQRLQAVGELAGGIAHDFNNLLTAILGATDDILARADSDLDREDLTQIRDSSQRGAALVRQLLAFSSQQTLQPRVIALNEAIRRTAQLLQRLLGQNVAMTLELEEPGRMVRIDPTQLDQVLMNLAVNAGHAMPQGGRLTIGASPRLVLRPETFGGEVVPPGRYACLSVSDTGRGIPPELLPRIFEPFFTTKRETGGTGLGLSTVHGIVRQSGGYMAVESKQGVGTQFRILLPRHEEASLWEGEAPSERAPPASLAEAIGRTVLLVDDEAAVRRLAERALRRQGFEVIAAASAEEALESLAHEDPAATLACVISDVVMPGLDGPALVRQLRTTWPNLPAILMSGYADLALRDSLQAADICFLAKPFSMAELTQAACKLVPAPGRLSVADARG
jgi:two-component system cell cycle sensor histidine kinase/response regulator CckA